MEFFINIQKNISEENYTRLIQKLKIEKYNKYQIIFKIDSLAKDFYIILSGSVYVLTP